MGKSERLAERLYFAEQDRTVYWDSTGAVFPLFNHDEQIDTFLGVVGLADITPEQLSGGYNQIVEDALEKARIVLWQRRYLTSAYQVLRSKTNQQETNFFRSGSVLDQSNLLEQSGTSELDEVSIWVKDALTHYWGGPKLSENPLLKWRIVQETAAESCENEINSLRAVLKKALEELRPESERQAGGEWTLYNLIDLKFFEKQKVLHNRELRHSPLYPLFHQQP